MSSAWMGLIGVLLGASLAGFLTWLNLRKQLEHDAAQRLLEREHDLRRSLFIEAAAGLQKANKALAALGKVETNFEEASNEFADGLAKFSMIGYVAQPNTLEASSALTNELGVALLQTLLNRKHMDHSKGDVEICGKMLDKYLAQQTHATELMKDYNLSGNHDATAFERIQRYFDSSTAELDRLFEERDRLQKIADKAMSEFMRSILPLREKLNRLGIRVTASIRTELGFPIDEDALLRMSAQASEEANQVMDHFLRNLFQENDQQ